MSFLWYRLAIVIRKSRVLYVDYILLLAEHIILFAKDSDYEGQVPWFESPTELTVGTSHV